MKRLLCIAFLSINSTLFAQEWQPLFDGHSFAGWTNQSGQPVDAEAWEVRDGMLHLDRSNGKKGGNLLSDQEYGDFELIFEWKVAPKANNGIKYRVKEFGGKTLGLEYQVIDDYGQPQLAPNHKTASIYDIYDVDSHSHLRPADEFNRGRIVVQNNRIQHWLNGHLITEAEVGSEEWNERIAKSKFADVEGFGLNHFGHIMLTDHKDEVWYRNIFIRDLQPAAHQNLSLPMESATAPCCCPQASRPPQRRRIFGRLFRR